MKITQKDVRESLDYNPDTGIFTWKKRNSNRIKVGDVAGVPNDQGYILIGLNGRRYRAHQLAFMYVNGYMTKYIDHRDGNRSNNKWSNIRQCSQSENMYNARIRIDNKSGVKGIWWSKKDKLWHTYININKKRINLGWFKDKELAELVALEARDKYHGDFGRVR